MYALWDALLGEWDCFNVCDLQGCGLVGRGLWKHWKGWDRSLFYVKGE